MIVRGARFAGDLIWATALAERAAGASELPLSTPHQPLSPTKTGRAASIAKCYDAQRSNSLAATAARWN